LDACSSCDGGISEPIMVWWGIMGQAARVRRCQPIQGRTAPIVHQWDCLDLIHLHMCWLTHYMHREHYSTNVESAIYRLTEDSCSHLALRAPQDPSHKHASPAPGLLPSMLLPLSVHGTPRQICPDALNVLLFTVTFSVLSFPLQR
jgi:hypothetical protein